MTMNDGDEYQVMHVSCMTNLRADSHVGACRDVSALQGLSLKQRGGTTADAADR